MVPPGHGSRVEMRLRGIENVRSGLEGIVLQLYGAEMQLAKIAGTEWAYNAVMVRPGEEPRIHEKVTLSPPAIEGQSTAYSERWPRVHALLKVLQA
jgi:hypothetical protein